MDDVTQRFTRMTSDALARHHDSPLERERAEDEAWFRAVVDSARDYAILTLDPAGRVKTWNEGAQRIKGYAADEIIGKHFSVFYRPGEAGQGLELLATALRDGRAEGEGWRVRQDGSQFWADVVVTALFDHDGTHIGFSKITRDLSERRKAEEDRLQLAHAQEALRLRDEFLSIASHELRTPLVALQLQVDSLRAQAGDFPARHVEKLDRAGRNIHRLAALITALLDVSRIATGKLSLRKTHTALGDIVGEAIDRLQDNALAARCEVGANLEPGVIASWDPLRLGQLVSNLLTNAFKYAARSRVDVTLAREGDIAVLRFEDRGPGIPAGAHERIFERFERAAPEHQGGMGLGLYVAREIAQAHGGTITAGDREGGGAVVEVRLPICDNADE